MLFQVFTSTMDYLSNKWGFWIWIVNAMLITYNYNSFYALQGWCGILIFDKYTYLASFWYLSLYKYPKYTYEHPKYTYYQNILMKRVSVQKYPKGGPLGIKCKLFINISFYLRRSYGTIRMSIGDIRMLEREKISWYPTFAVVPPPDWISQKHRLILNFMRFLVFSRSNILISSLKIYL